MQVIDITGEKYGKLTVIKRTEDYVSPGGRKIVQFECKCDCGNTVITSGYNLRKGKVVSCGCKGKHGGSHTRLYAIWSNMIYRCSNENASNYENYGGRGISVCEQWQGKAGFEKFREWAVNNGYEETLTIDRADPDGNYEPTNCRWADNKTQIRNRRNTIFLTYKGKTKPVAEWSEITGIERHTIYRRMNAGLSPDEILRK